MATYDRDGITPLPSDAALPTIWTSAVGQTRLSGAMLGSSVKPLKADIWRPMGNVAEVPEADFSMVLRVPMRSLREAGLAHAFGKPVPRGDVAKGLGLDPLANPEMGFPRQIEFGHFTRFL
jgi:hypothetical protein